MISSLIHVNRSMVFEKFIVGTVDMFMELVSKLIMGWYHSHGHVTSFRCHYVMAKWM